MAKILIMTIQVNFVLPHPSLSRNRQKLLELLLLKFAITTANSWLLA